MSPETRHDEDARREFWIFHMERSARLLRAMEDGPTRESGESLASIPEAAAEAAVEMWFSDSKIAGDLDRIFFIRRGLIPDLIAIGRDHERARLDPQDRRRLPHQRDANPARAQAGRLRHDRAQLLVGMWGPDSVSGSDQAPLDVSRSQLSQRRYAHYGGRRRCVRFPARRRRSRPCGWGCR